MWYSKSGGIISEEDIRNAFGQPEPGEKRPPVSLDKIKVKRKERGYTKDVIEKAMKKMGMS